jgi:hypothetical protein
MYIQHRGLLSDTIHSIRNDPHIVMLNSRNGSDRIIRSVSLVITVKRNLK